MKVTVTKEDIKRGRAGDCTACPVALAIRRDLPPVSGAVRVAVSMSSATIGRKVYLLPPEATDFIREFDVHLPVEPFKFEMEPFDPHKERS